ncbi:hypothetical protein [Paraliomyxa miuraensis]|uniref:hypothetical protein n=1 Tax=Paraliomyxa miuraensis TaxID=376150 RepID=UPI00225B595D|nr:hypothetical protein [Paraliomyxa miuraensis]MCX4245828.1 hypothetical protein [Paraliomyxa miuraensis]
MNDDAALERLDAILAELEISSAQLREDPWGDQWLPQEARALVEQHPQCRAALAEYVEGELALWSSSQDATPSFDPFFTARVVGSLPSPRTGTRLPPLQRAMLLGTFHAVAGVLAYIVLTMVPESTARWAEQAHSVLSWGSELGTSALVVAILGGAALTMFVLTRSRSAA